MKKFISTLTSLAMGASLTAGALAVPFVTNAADTKKSLTIVPEKTTISAAEIAAGDVKVKCQVFFDDVDGNNDTASIQAMMTFGDCASDNIKMTGLTNMFTISTEYNSIVCDSGLFYVGTISSRTKKFAPDGDYTGELVNDKRCAFSWTRPKFTGTYLGEKASDVPVGEFEVTISKGAAAGNYSIEFLNEDMTFVNPSYVGKDNATTAVSNKDYKTYDNKYFGGLETNGAVIKVEGSSSQQETTTPKTTTPVVTPAQGTTTTPKTNPGTQTDKLQWTISETKMDKGATDTVWVDVIVSNAWGSDAATEGLRGVAAGFKYDTANFTLTEVDTESCYGTLSENIDAGLISVTPASSEDTGIIANKGDGICYLGFTPKSANVAEGTYAITWDKSETKGILDPGSFGGVNDRPVKYADIDLVDGAIIVGNGGTPGTTTPVVTPAQETTTTPKTNPGTTTDKLQWSIKDAEMFVGDTDTVWVDVIVSNAWGSDAATEGLRGVAAGFKYDTANFTLTEVDTESCYGTLSENIDAGLISVTPASSEDTGIIANKGDGICYLGFTPKANVAAGTYAITWDKSETKGILDPGSFGGVNDRPVKYADLDLVDGAIVVKAKETTPKETTTTTTTTTPKQETTTTTTTPAPTQPTQPTETTPVPTQPTQPTTVTYGDTNCDGTVNIADVVMLNKYLTNAEKYPITDQGKKNADCDTKAGLTTNDSYCIIRSIVKLVTLPCAD